MADGTHSTVAARSWRNEYLVLGIILAIALVHGLIYVVIIPPWQHYDEPNHFEYAWLMANRNRIPASSDYDPIMRREVARSMIEHDFYKGMGFLPNLELKDQPISIGAYSQLGDPPLYYLLASLPLRLIPSELRYSTITWQLYLARQVSLFLYLTSIAIAFGLVREVTASGNPLRWLVPLCMALLPAYTDLMTAVNNDAAAVVVFSLFLWGSVRLIKYGFSWLRLVWVVLAAGLSYWTKSTIWFIFPLLGLVILLALAGIKHTGRGVPDRGKPVFIKGGSRVGRWLITGAIACFILVGFVAVFSWGDAALWYRGTMQPANTRLSGTTPPHGHYAFNLDFKNGEQSTEPVRLVQFIPPLAGDSLRGKAVTLGAWMWASRPIRVRAPELDYYGNMGMPLDQVDLGTTPKFYGVNVILPDNANRIMLNLSPISGAVDGDVTIFYDGLVLVAGEYPVDERPQFTDSSAKEGVWSGRPFSNLARNASAENGGMRLRNWADKAGSTILPDRGRPSLILYTALDSEATRLYYWNSIRHLLRTFWAKFGWAHVPLSGNKPYRLLGILTLVGIIGLPLALWHGRKNIAWRVVFFLGVVLAGVWGLALVRGSIYLTWRIFLPAARYAFPAIIPTVLALIIGWQAWVPAKGSKYLNTLIVTGFILLDVYALISIITYYRS